LALFQRLGARPDVERVTRIQAVSV
jgi:hypothetical protein